jgi:hypothetical protein
MASEVIVIVLLVAILATLMGMWRHVVVAQKAAGEARRAERHPDPAPDLPPPPKNNFVTPASEWPPMHGISRVMRVIDGPHIPVHLHRIHFAEMQG